MKPLAAPLLSASSTRRQRPQARVSTTAYWKLAMPSSTLPVPCSELTSRASPIDGRRRAASIRITLLPASASDDARLIAVVDLPSDGDGLVTSTAGAPVPVPRRDAARVARRVR